MNHLTTSILHSLYVDNPDKNWVFSPASYLEAMGSLALCLKDRNLAELEAVAPDIREPQAAGLDTYNALFYAAEYAGAIEPTVVESLRARGADLMSFYGAEVVDKVNAIVREKTRDKIDGLLSPGDIDALTKFIILNCVYFKRAWLNPFNEMWRVDQFHGATKVSNLKFLHHKIQGQRYYEGAGYDIVELPYKESDVACYLIVPTTETIFGLFDKVGEVMGHIADVKRGLDVDLKVPPFKVETTTQLAKSTSVAGVNSIFSWNKDWKLVDWSLLKEEAVMRVQSIIQKAYIEFDKEGTEAAAATAIEMCLSGCAIFPVELPPVKKIVADKPFIYVLANRNEPGKPLFVGVVNDLPDSKLEPTPRRDYSDLFKAFGYISGDIKLS